MTQGPKQKLWARSPRALPSPPTPPHQPTQCRHPLPPRQSFKLLLTTLFTIAQIEQLQYADQDFPPAPSTTTWPTPNPNQLKTSTHSFYYYYFYPPPLLLLLHGLLWSPPTPPIATTRPTRRFLAHLLLLHGLLRGLTAPPISTRSTRGGLP